jgi:hypothetical protein
MRYRFGLTIARSCIADVRIDRFLCGKTLMKKLRVARTHGGDGSRNSQRNPLKSSLAYLTK